MLRFGLITPDTNAELEAMRLHALVDGLVVHALTNPHVVTPEMIRETIALHLDSLMGK